MDKLMDMRYLCDIDESDKRFDDLRDYIKEHGFDINCVEVNLGQMAIALPATYMNKNEKVYLNFGSIQKDGLEMCRSAEVREGIMEAWKEKNLASYVAMTDKRYYGWALYHIMMAKEDLDPREFWDTFIHIWVASEYLNNCLPPYILEQVFIDNPDKEKEVEHLRKRFNSDTITIYRGEGSKSNNFFEDRSLSWTLSKDKAIWFANRFSSFDKPTREQGEVLKDRTVYKAVINVEDILAYIDDTEDEVIVSPDKIKKYETIEFTKEE